MAKQEQQDTTQPEAREGTYLPALKEIKPFSEFEAQLAALREKNKTVFNYNDPKGNAEARSHVHSMRRVKGDLERRRKEVKADALAFGRAIDSSAAALETELDALIKVHADELKRLEEQEAERKATIEARINSISDLSLTQPNATAASLQERLEKAQGFAVDSTFDEFADRAEQVRTGVVAILEQLLEAAKQREANEAELARLREEKAQRERKEEEERLEREREERAAQEQRERVEREAEAQRERERQAEADRVQRIRDSIKVLKVVALASDTPELIEIKINDLIGKWLGTDGYAEFAEEAQQTYEAAIDGLKAAQQAAHERIQQEQENARLRREQAEQQKRTALIEKISLFRHFLPAPADTEHTIASKQVRLIKPDEKEYGDLFTQALEAYQQAFDALKAKREEFDIARKRAEEQAAAEKREANKRHRNKIHNAASVAILNAMTNAPDSDAIASAIVEAIAAGQVPHVKIEY